MGQEEDREVRDLRWDTEAQQRLWDDSGEQKDDGGNWNMSKVGLGWLR